MTIPALFRSRSLPALRRPLACLALALAATAAAAEDKATCQYLQMAKVPLHYTGPGLGVTMDGTIDGTPAQMLVDTGAFQTMLTRTGTEKRDMHLSYTGDHIQGVGGLSRIYATRVKEFIVGPAKSAKGWMQVIGDTGTAPAYDAIAGAPFLLQRDLEIALAEKEIRFYRPMGCNKDAHLAYWDPNAIAIPFEYSRSRSPNPHFTVEINGEKLEAIIDSGAWSTSIDSRAAKRAGLKFDTPDATRLGDTTGIGERHVANWSTVAETFKIGDEVIQNARVGVMDTRGELDVDVLIGDDFLRSHRVLFAMSQQKLYISYVGGEPLGQRTTFEPWIQKEAEGGNPDAQMVLALVYDEGKLVPRNPAMSAQWLDKAAQLGHPRAQLLQGRKLMATSRYQEAATLIAGALDKLPAERFGALWLYVARLRSAADPAQARRELETTFGRDEDHPWPAPVADFYLGRIDATALLTEAGKEAKLAKGRTCQASSFMADLYAAQGNAAQAASLKASVQAHCAPAPAAARTAGT